METTYIGFKLWSAAVEAAGSIDVNKVRDALNGRSVKALSGFTVRFDPTNHHLHKPVIIGRIEDGKINYISISKQLIPPEPWSPWLGSSRDKSRGTSGGNLLQRNAAAVTVHSKS
jgi:urea transport system substrate-binding protein